MKSKSENSQSEFVTAKHRFKGSLAACLISLAGYFPLSLSQRIGKYLGRLMLLVNTKEVKIARRNISICFPDMSKHEKSLFLRKVFEHGGMQLFEIAFLWKSTPEKSLSYVSDITGEDILDEAIQEVKGLIIILPHLGNWEMMNGFLCKKMDIRAMYSPAKLAEVDRLMHEGRSKTGLSLSPANVRGISSMIQTLKKRGNVLILPDQEPIKDSGEFAPFLGIEAYTMTLISKMLRKTDARALLAYVKRLEVGEGFELIFKSVPDEIYSEDLRTSLTALNKCVEDAIIENPEQYMWGYKRFRKRPEGEKKLYKDLL